MGSAILRVLFSIGVLLHAGSALSMFGEDAVIVPLDLAQEDIIDGKDQIIYTDHFPLVAKIAYAIDSQELKNQIAVHYQTSARLSDAELRQISRDVLKANGKEWAYKAVVGLLFVGANFGYSCAIDQIPISWVFSALFALQIGIDSAVLNRCLSR